MKILLISYYFAPQNTIAAVRTTKIAKYLVKNGFEVDVICGPSETVDPILLSDAKIIKNIEIINNHFIINKLLKKLQQPASKSSISKGNKKLSPKYRIIKNILSILPNPVALYLDFINSLLWYYEVRERSKIIASNQYDVVLSSYGPISSHMLGLFVKNKQINALWIADYRDPVVNDSLRGIIKSIYNYYQNKFLCKSDLTTCVSDGLKLELQKLNKKAKIYTISNGYDPEDVNLTLIKDNQILFEKNKLIFSYCGTLYKGRRDLSPLFFALKNLISEKKVKKENIEVHYAGNDFTLLMRMARKYGLENLLINHGFISRDKSFQLTSNSDIALAASWNTKYSQGVITGKIYELFMLKKSILCFINGNIGNSELKRIIQNANAGCVYEETIKNINEIVKYIFNTYNKKLIEAKIDQKYNNEYIKQFDYNNIIINFISLIDKNKSNLK